MPRYKYRARDAAGKLVVGAMDGADERAVAASLTQQGHQPLSIQPEQPVGAPAEWRFFRRQRVTRQEILILFRELAALLRAGIPLSKSLEGAIQQSQSPALRALLTDVANRVQGGWSLSEAFAAHSDVFPELFNSMVRVGETAGILDQVLDRLAQLGTQELEMQSKISAAVVYPIALVGFSLLVVTGLLVGVLPKFIAVFQASKVALPVATRILLGISWVVQHFWWLLVILGVGGWWQAKRFYATDTGRYWVDGRLLRVPLMGTLMRKILVARLSRTLGAMLKTGVPLLEALQVTEKTVPNVVFQKALRKSREAVAEGKSLSAAWESSGLFPPLVLHLASVGERSGQLDAMLLEVSLFYDPEIELTVRNLTTLLEPALLVTMGLMVGFIALSVLLPIFQLIHVFKR